MNIDNPRETIKVGFILQPHFSLMAFTAAVDALITANLVHDAPLYEIHTFGVGSQNVLSDIGIDIATDASLGSLNRVFLNPTLKDKLDWLFVCGGYRCDTASVDSLVESLQSAHQQEIKLGSLWNGTIALAHAGVLNLQSISAIHPNSHSFMLDNFPKLTLSNHTYEVSADYASCAGPNSAMEMMLSMIKKQFDRKLVRAIREVLSCDQASEGRQAMPDNQKLDNQKLNTQKPDNQNQHNLKSYNRHSSNLKSQNPDPLHHPTPLQDAIDLMTNNIEEPLSAEELAQCLSISRRQLERLFQTHLDISPSRYYLKLRLVHAHHQLEQKRESIIQIGLSCGFVSSSHFSNCFKDHFGYSPNKLRTNSA